MKFYYINLNRSQDRNKNMLLFFNNLSNVINNVDFERVEGLDGNNEDLDNYISLFKFSDLKGSYYINKNIYHYGVKFNTHNKAVFEIPLKKGEFGCLYSHLKAIYNFTKSEEDFAFICEDDLDNNFIYKSDYLNEQLNYLIKELDKYGIIIISSVGSNKIINNILNNKMFKKTENLYKFIPYCFYGTGCYLINKKIAKKIIDSCIIFKEHNMILNIPTTKTSLVADNFIYSFANTHVYLPSLFFIKDNNDSLINNNISKQHQSQDLMIKYLIENNFDNLQLDNKKNTIEKTNTNSEITKIKSKKKSKITNYLLLKSLMR